METLKERTAKGLVWSGIANGAQQLLGLAFGIVLGRLLSPSDYGMIAMITIFSLVASALQESGFRMAIANIREPRHDDYNAVFWFNVIVGTGLYTLLFLCAPLIGDYYHTDAIVPLCRYAFLAIILSALGTAQSAYIYKNLRTKQQAKATITATITSSLVGVVMAFLGCRYWSLATQTIVFNAMNTLLLWHYSPWRPSLRGITFAPVRRMLPFSVKLLATNITTHVNNNVLNILLGHYFTAHATGNFNQASQWTSKCYYLIQNMMGQVVQPTLVGLGDDQARQLNALRKMVRFTAFISFPLLLGLGLVAKEFIVLAITEKWLASATIMQLLCISGATIPLSSVLSNMIVSKGRSGTYFWSTFTLGLTQIAALLTVWPWGLHTMVVVHVAINVVWLLVWYVLVRRLTGYGLVAFLADVVPFAAGAFGVMAATHFATLPIANLWLLLGARIVMAVLLYYAVMRLARVRMLDECMAFVLRKRSGK